MRVYARAREKRQGALWWPPSPASSSAVVVGGSWGADPPSSPLLLLLPISRAPPTRQEPGGPWKKPSDEGAFDHITVIVVLLWDRDKVEKEEDDVEERKEDVRYWSCVPSSGKRQAYLGRRKKASDCRELFEKASAVAGREREEEHEPGAVEMAPQPPR